MRRALACLLVLAVAPARAGGPAVVTVDTPAPLVTVRIMVRAGSADDPKGSEGLAHLAGRLLIEGSFGDPDAPVTKEALAELTRPWGSGAYPEARVSKETTTFSMLVPRELLAEYVEKVLGPMFTRPLFDGEELARLREEALQRLRSDLRLEQIELLGLVALDAAIHEGTSYAHPDIGTERGLKAVETGQVRRFYRTYYEPENMIVALSTADPEASGLVRDALGGAGALRARALKKRDVRAPEGSRGRSALIVTQPNAVATGLHAGFPIAVTRSHPDYWPLYVGNVWFGAHRDSFSHLYKVLREERGYNYGDYSYIEHFEGRPFALFPPPNTPRRRQYFSLWVRPVAHEHAAHVLKAAAWELERFVREGLSEEQCSMARNKAKVLYLSLAETTGRLTAYRLDDAFYGLEPGYLDSYLEKVEGVSCEQVNAAIRRHLRREDLKIVAVTDDERAAALAEALASGGPAWGKRPEDYQIDVVRRGGKKVYQVPEEKLELLRRDAAWAHHPLELKAGDVRVVPAERMFETAALPD